VISTYSENNNGHKGTDYYLNQISLKTVYSLQH